MLCCHTSLFNSFKIPHLGKVFWAIGSNITQWRDWDTTLKKNYERKKQRTFRQFKKHS